MEKNIIQNLKDALEENIQKLQEHIYVQKQWNDRLETEDCAKTIIDYKQEFQEYISKDYKEVDELCEKFFEVYTELLDIECDNDRFCDRFSGDNYADKVDSSNSTFEEVELLSDEEIIKAAETADDFVD